MAANIEIQMMRTAHLGRRDHVVDCGVSAVGMSSSSCITAAKVHVAFQATFSENQQLRMNECWHSGRFYNLCNNWSDSDLLVSFWRKIQLSSSVWDKYFTPTATT